MKDPIIEGLHQHRLEHARKFNFDLAAICEDLRKRGKDSGLPMALLSARRLLTPSRSSLEHRTERWRI